ncbi:MAG: SDR family NAD(P)-dependent oxidoreductase [Acidimicrobiia bacterium]|nr:SDR family NAD(P)-dependent oxidoreductase [Acidimicrobiia bacterium]
MRYDGRVALVTGSGRGLGRSHARFLASRGALVVVNDMGSEVDGTGRSDEVADQVVEDIRAAGGEAVADYHDVATTDGAIGAVETTMDAYDKIDIVVNNAGILRDRTLAKLAPDDFDAVVAGHLSSSAYVTHAAWPYLRDRSYGRVVFTTSAAGLYGNFGQANYAAAKMALVGLMNTLALEGEPRNVRVNTIAPVAATRMTEPLMTPEVLSAMVAEYVTPVVGWFCSEDCSANGVVVEAGAGHFALVEVMEGAGYTFTDPGSVSPDDIAAHWGEIADMSAARPFADANSAVGKVLAAHQSAKAD